MVMNPRKAKLLEELPKHNYKVKPAAIKAGYSESYADANPKQILKTALRAQAQALMDTASDANSIPSKGMKKELASTIGLTMEEVQNALKKIALNDRDFASALKVLAVIARQDLDFNLNPEETKITVPVLNIGVRENGPVEPYIEAPRTE
jgi:hypothetical protein